MPAVSVIVPNYNHARFLRRRIDSVLQQTFQDFELILLDDCSTDDSRSILLSYASDPRVRMEFNDANSGSTFKQWNKGVRLARGKYVWIAESDDYADEKLLERLVAHLQIDDKIAFACCRCWRVSDEGQVEGFADDYLTRIDSLRWTVDFYVEGRDMCRSYFVRTNPFPNASAVVFRKSIYEQVGGADERLRLCGDWKLWAAMALTGKVAYVAEPLNYFRFHPTTVRNKSVLANVNVTESLSVIRWLLARTAPSKDLAENIGKLVADAWVPAVMSTHFSFAIKRAMLQNVWNIDPHPFRHAFRPALATIRLKLLRHWNSLRSARR